MGRPARQLDQGVRSDLGSRPDGHADQPDRLERSLDVGGLERRFELLFVELSVVNQKLAQILFWIVGV